MDKELEKIYKCCKANGYDESCETFENDLSELLIRQIGNKELSKVAGGKKIAKTFTATLISVLNIASPFASANQNSTTEGTPSENVSSVSVDENASSGKKSRIALLKDILLKKVLPVVGLGALGIGIEELVRRRPWEKKDTGKGKTTDTGSTDKPSVNEPQAEAEEQRRLEEEKRRQDEEARLRAQEQQRKAQEAEAARLRAEAQRRLEEQRKAQEEQRRAEEAKRRLEEEKRRQDEEARLRAQEQQRKAQEEEQRKAQEEQRKAEEAKRRLEEEKRRAEEQARLRAEQQRKAQEEQQRKAAEEQRKAQEAEAARLRAEEKRKQEEQRRAQEAERQRKAQEELRMARSNEEYLEEIRKDKEELRRRAQQDKEEGKPIRVTEISYPPHERYEKKPFDIGEKIPNSERYYPVGYIPYNNYHIDPAIPIGPDGRFCHPKNDSGQPLVLGNFENLNPNSEIYWDSYKNGYIRRDLPDGSFELIAVVATPDRIYRVDEHDKPIYPRDSENRPILPVDLFGTPIFPINKDGKIVLPWEDPKATHKKVTFPVDENGRYIIPYLDNSSSNIMNSDYINRIRHFHGLDFTVEKGNGSYNDFRVRQFEVDGYTAAISDVVNMDNEPVYLIDGIHYIQNDKINEHGIVNSRGLRLVSFKMNDAADKVKVADKAKVEIKYEDKDKCVIDISHKDCVAFGAKCRKYEYYQNNTQYTQEDLDVQKYYKEPKMVGFEDVIEQSEKCLPEKRYENAMEQPEKSDKDETTKVEIIFATKVLLMLNNLILHEFFRPRDYNDNENMMNLIQNSMDYLNIIGIQQYLGIELVEKYYMAKKRGCNVDDIELYLGYTQDEHAKNIRRALTEFVQKYNITIESLESLDIRYLVAAITECILPNTPDYAIFPAPNQGDLPEFFWTQQHLPYYSELFDKSVITNLGGIHSISYHADPWLKAVHKKGYNIDNIYRLWLEYHLDIVGSNPDLKPKEIQKLFMEFWPALREHF